MVCRTRNRGQRSMDVTVNGLVEVKNASMSEKTTMRVTVETGALADLTIRAPVSGALVNCPGPIASKCALVGAVPSQL